jgi:two-component system, NtrC family, sensor kinase
MIALSIAKSMKFGTKLIISLVCVVLVIMTIHGYLSMQQDQDSIDRELRVGMRGYARMVRANLHTTYAESGDLGAMQRFIDVAAPRGNIHAIVVFNGKGEIIARSDSIRYGTDFPELEPTPIIRLDPGPVLKNGKGMDGYIRQAGKLIYYRIEPIFNASNQPVGAFVLARQGYRLFANIAARRNRIIATTSVLVLVLSFLIWVIVRHNVSHPINELITRIREIGKGEWRQRIEVSGQDEVASLAREFNLMSEELEQSHSRLLQEQKLKLELEQELRHSERLASVGRLAAGIAHEIGTPLNIISGRAEYLSRRPRSAEEIKTNLELIRSQTDRIAAIVRQLLEFSRRREPVFRRVDVTALVNHVTYLMEHQLQSKAIGVEISGPRSLPNIYADPDLLQQVFLNLFSNSLHALGAGGTIKIHTELTDGERLFTPSQGTGSGLQITFEDNGGGIAAEHIGRIFDPFFTTKDIGEGTGLGLSVSYGIIKDHGGEIYAESEPGQFTRFLIFLPLNQYEKENGANSHVN